MAMSSRIVIVIVIACILAGCGSVENEKRLQVFVGRDIQAVSKNPADYQPIQWAMIRGGNQESLTRGVSYYMLISSPDGIPPGRSLTVMVVAGDAALLMIAVHEGAETQTHDRFHLDTDGWTEYLRMYGTADQPWDVYFSLSGDEKDFHAKLPTLQELGRGSSTLKLTEVPARVLDGYESIDRGSLIPGMIPAIARMQGNEKTIYTFFRKK